MKPRGRTIQLDQIDTDPGLQIRVVIHQDKIDEWAETLKEYPEYEFPPVIVFLDADGKHWLADGHHRLEAYRLAGRGGIPVKVKQGTFDDAQEFALTANVENSIPLGREDKQNAIKIEVERLKKRGIVNPEVRPIARKHGISSGMVNHYLHPEKYQQQQDARTLRMAGKLSDRKESVGLAKPTPVSVGLASSTAGKFTCPDECGESWDDRQRWHCERCDGHNLPEVSICSHCSIGKRPGDAEDYLAAEKPADPDAPVPMVARGQDEEGHELPERLSPVFAKRSVFNEFEDAVNKAKRFATDLGSCEAGRMVHLQTVLRDLDNAKEGVRFARPHAVCPYCHADGSDCKGCKRSGFVNRSTYQQAPKKPNAA